MYKLIEFICDVLCCVVFDHRNYAYLIFSLKDHLFSLPLFIYV